MKYLIIVMFLLPSLAWADIFSKSSEQGELNQALDKDVHNLYYRGGYDYNAYAPAEPSYQLRRQNISLGCNRYDYHESLKNLFTRNEFSDIELELLMQQLSTSRFLVWQYSSPTLADLYKHLDVMGNLRVGFRYQQCEDLEKVVDDPIVKLRKQAIMDCMKRKEGNSDMDDIDKAFKECFDSLNSGGALSEPYETLADPGDGNFYISGTVNVTEKTLDRVNKNNEDLTIIKEIIPQVTITDDSVNIISPLKSSRELIFEYRKYFLNKISDLLKEYRISHEVNQAQVEALSVFGAPLTEGQIKNMAMLDETSAYLSMNKVASELAYLKIMDQYVLASQMLDRVMSHPAIQPGYKTLLKTDIDFVQKEIFILKEEKERLGQYVGVMNFILNEADRKRIEVLTLIKNESEDQSRKGLFKLNP